MAVPRSPVAGNVNTNRGGRNSRVAPPAPAVGFEYSPEELVSFTAEQRLWIAEHPRYWELRSQSRDDSDDDFRNPLESPAAGSSTTGTNDDGDTTMNESDGTVKGKSRVAPPVSGLNSLASLSVKTPVPVLTLPAPQITDTKDTSSLTRLHELALRNAAIHGSSSINVYETNVGGLISASQPPSRTPIRTPAAEWRARLHANENWRAGWHANDLQGISLQVGVQGLRVGVQACTPKVFGVRGRTPKLQGPKRIYICV
ncbi:hypothetical protein PGTUg99_021099 [Puccinia graminis f. sp. tritici]|uniref:Uncharacterized protein n=1 Tax=Puccinia graminis f. sp. tritici TaxID=56615 RepID=A0A5B0PH65_PUCGR|nr:hypothetical protein PGTUg99_021099 [Puccinia graminis f. sp. tritici]